MRNFVNRIRINNIVDNVSIINKTCKLAGIDRISAKSVNIEDDKVWKEIAEDTDLIFQVSGNFGQRTIKQIFSSESQKKIFGHSNLTRMDLFSFTNALLRPCGKSVYNDAINGIARITNVEPIDKEFSSELGYPLFQETQMKFVMDFCGYSFLQADRLRKCIAKGSLITMADGTLKVIEDIKVGDRVISFDGKVFSGQNVKNVWNNGKKQIVKVKCEDGIELKCTQDHKIMTQNGWKMACDITKNDWIYTPKKIICDNDNLRSNEKLYGQQYWLLGALIGDGTIGSSADNLSFTNSDIEVINKAISSLKYFVKNPKYRIYSTKGTEVDNIYRLCFRGNIRNSLLHLLEKYDLRKTASEKHIPNKILELNPSEKLLSFIAGLFNTDGGYNKNNLTIEYYSISKTLIEQLRVLLQKIGIYSKVCSKTVKKYGYNSYTLYISGADNFNIFEEKILPFIVGRKKIEIKSIIDESPDKLRYYIPSECKNEVKLWCKNRNISVRHFYLNSKLPEIKLSNNRGWSAEQAKKAIQNCFAPYTYEVIYGDFMCVPVVSVEKSEIETVYDIEVENTHNFLANNVLVHNCIAKKMGTREELPVIKKGFFENGKVNLGLSDQKTEEVIEPFLQCILDATRYSFCRIHAYSYSYIGYMCAYLRTYYPLEYLTACLSVWEGKTEKTAEVMNYMKKKKYSIQEARFRHSKSDYMFDKSTKTIYKGMKSIKYMNKICSDQLYELRNNKYNSFTDLLFDVKNLQIDTRQVEILIRLDYFREFGNSKELLVIYKNFLKFKKGEAKTIAINKISDDTILNGIVKRHSKSTEKQYKDLDNRGILNECEDYIKGQNIPDLPIKVKIEDEKEYLGYISMKTENPNDRPKLLVLSKRTMISKKGRNQGKPWCVVIDTYSIGSGIQSNFTILYNVYEQEPFNKGDIIYCDKWEKRNGYFYMTKYHLVF